MHNYTVKYFEKHNTHLREGGKQLKERSARNVYSNSILIGHLIYAALLCTIRLFGDWTMVRGLSQKKMTTVN